MIAVLGMYDRPETSGANDTFWSLIRSNLGYGPERLTRGVDVWQAWQSPDLLFAQTCGLPFRHSLHKLVHLVGTPDYDVEGCPPGYYRSVIVARSDVGVDLSDLSRLRFAYNEKLSQSGWAAFWAHVPKGGNVKEMVQTGAHAASARAVAEGRADIAALDVVTWNQIRTYDAFADHLSVIAKTEPSPGLPFITAKSRNPVEIAHAVVKAMDNLDENSRKLLQIKGFVPIPREAYLTIPLPRA
ncbi:MAG: PhnD/SsuA/transferrin family substrate-binding protein [Paracoccaceae bacterium]|jgi:ABC-type phosphate/phosphonate transport system substrate-binding protein|nr:PhnD/SsuA/transferrin family substrate-binding protein [Paracoccaceae bacterium]MDP7186667.1 PhnD/SsuA/transferrin family substrate-binding protein [Paracoccaceae bacterium]